MDILAPLQTSLVFLYLPVGLVTKGTWVVCCCHSYIDKV